MQIMKVYKEKINMTFLILTMMLYVKQQKPIMSKLARLQQRRSAMILRKVTLQSQFQVRFICYTYSCLKFVCSCSFSNYLDVTPVMQTPPVVTAKELELFQMQNIDYVTYNSSAAGFFDMQENTIPTAGYPEESSDFEEEIKMLALSFEGENKNDEALPNSHFRDQLGRFFSFYSRMTLKNS